MKKIICPLMIGVILLGACTTCEKWFEEHEKNNFYKGFVLRKYPDTSFNGRNEPTVILGSSQEYEQRAYPVFNSYIFEIIDSGDYIYKDSGSLKRLLIKQSDTIVYFPQCGEKDINKM